MVISRPYIFLTISSDTVTRTVSELTLNKTLHYSYNSLNRPLTIKPYFILNRLNYNVLNYHISEFDLSSSTRSVRVCVCMCVCGAGGFYLVVHFKKVNLINLTLAGPCIIIQFK
jgi:hypothetical protein